MKHDVVSGGGQQLCVCMMAIIEHDFVSPCKYVVDDVLFLCRQEWMLSATMFLESFR